MEKPKNLITDEQRKKFLENKGMKCPVCGSEDIVPGNDFSLTDGEGSESFTCDDCNAYWVNIYTLADIILLS